MTINFTLKGKAAAKIYGSQGAAGVILIQMYSHARLKKYRDELNFPNCDNVCRDVLIIAGPGPLLGTLEDMDDIINAIMKVYENRDKLGSI